jgi:hypothetical protein
LGIIIPPDTLIYVLRYCTRVKQMKILMFVFQLANLRSDCAALPLYKFGCVYVNNFDHDRKRSEVLKDSVTYLGHNG